MGIDDEPVPLEEGTLPGTILVIPAALALAESFQLASEEFRRSCFIRDVVENNRRNRRARATKPAE